MLPPRFRRWREVPRAAAIAQRNTHTVLWAQATDLIEKVTNVIVMDLEE